MDVDEEEATKKRRREVVPHLFQNLILPLTDRHLSVSSGCCAFPTYLLTKNKIKLGETNTREKRKEKREKRKEKREKRKEKRKKRKSQYLSSFS